jgi:hypothetical protein
MSNITAITIAMIVVRKRPESPVDAAGAAAIAAGGASGGGGISAIPARIA